MTDPRGLDVGAFMSDAAEAGVTVMLKIDGERLGARPWTVLLSGHRLGGAGAVRRDCRSLGECIDWALARLGEAADGEWLDPYRARSPGACGVDRREVAGRATRLDAEDVEALLGSLADLGITVLVQVDHSAAGAATGPWSTIISGPPLGARAIRRDGRTSFAECLVDGLRELRAEESGADLPELVDVFCGINAAPTRGPAASL